jgi:hypothetical protein
LGVYRDYISDDTDMQTMLFRYSIMVDVFNAHLPAELKCQYHLSDVLKKKILRQPYSEQNDRLILLFGMGIIGEATLKELVLHNKTDFLSDVIKLEDRVRTDEDKNESERLSYETLEQIILLCANSQKFDEFSPLPFEQAEKLISNSHIFIENGFVKCDKDMAMLVNESGGQMGYYDENSDSIFIEKPEYVAAALADNYDVSSETAPIVTDYKALLCYSYVYDLLYGREFIKYASDNHIPCDKNYVTAYEKYLKKIKLTFDIKAYTKKRNICGNKVNYFDYAFNTVENNELVQTALNADEAYSAEIVLDVNENYTDAELTVKALNKYKNSRQLLDKTVIEIMHGNNILLYIYDSGNFTAIDSTSFRNQLFDFDKIWSVIQLCSRDGSLKRVNNTITIPQKYLNEIEPNQREYAERMISEQYSRMLRNRRVNPLVQSLNDLKVAAEQNMEAIQKEKAEKAALKAAALQARAGRKPGISLNENSESENNGG